MDTTYEYLTTHPFLAGLPAGQLERLARWSRPVSLPAGTTMFEENGPARSFWLIREGLVDLRTDIPGRGAVVVDTIDAGDVLGWSWLFPPWRWHFSAVTVSPVSGLECDATGVRALCREEPALGHELTLRFTAVVVRRMQATRLRLLDLYGAPPG